MENDEIYKVKTILPGLKEIDDMSVEELTTLKLKVQRLEEYLAKLIRSKIQR